MKILVTADLHGYDKAFVQFAEMLKLNNYDAGVLCGDLMTFPSEQELSRAKQELESESTAVRARMEAPDPAVVQRALLNKEKEYKYILRGSGRSIVFVMGNDDGLLGDGPAWSSEKGITDINERRARLGKYNFVGYQYTSPFIGGTFEKSEVDQTKDLDRLAGLIDEHTVLVTHGPPWGILDAVFEGRRVGSKALRRVVDRKRPMLHVFGHIHHSFGTQEIWANCAYPHCRRFVGVDLETREFSIIDPSAGRAPAQLGQNAAS
jgi:Icc-related predicted phosphoesterase